MAKCVQFHLADLSDGIVTQASDRPTMETRSSLIATAQRQAEDTRIQVRKAQQASVKRGKFSKNSIELEEVRSSLDQICRSNQTVVVHAFSVSKTHKPLRRRR